MKKFEQLDHTADVGITAYGKDTIGLFLNAAHGMFSIITDVKYFYPKKKVEIEVSAENKDELLVAWLRELLFYYSTKYFVFVDFKIKSISDQMICATAFYDEIKDIKLIEKDIKAVTYHNLHIDKKDNYYEVQIIFDV